MNDIQPLRILAFAALTLSVRVLTWVSLLFAAGLFAYAVIEPNPQRTVAASLFAVLIFLPSIFVEKRRQPVKPPAVTINAGQPQQESEVSYG